MEEPSKSAKDRQGVERAHEKSEDRPSCSGSGDDPSSSSHVKNDRRSKCEKLARGWSHLDSWKRLRKDEIEEDFAAAATSTSQGSDCGADYPKDFKKRVSETFHSFASNSSQGSQPTFSRVELRNLLNAFNLYPNESDLDQLFTEWVGDKNKGIDEELYVQWMIESMKSDGLSLESMERVFKILDVDGNGALGMKELKTCLATLNEEVPGDAISSMLTSVGDSGRERLTSTNLYKYVNHFASDPLLSTLHNLNLSQVSADDDTDAEN